jgi:tRNA dimethylallyltransferase
VVILGATASGKTKLACALAAELNGEIISADSRQVYRHLNLGSGKDLTEYTVAGKQIPYHLIDCADVNTQFYLHDFLDGLDRSFKDIVARKQLPIICGGSGLYLDALHKDFSNTAITENADLRASLEHLTNEALLVKLKAYAPHLWQQVDLQSRKRVIRGIEIAEYRSSADAQTGTYTFDNTQFKPLYIGLRDEKHRRDEKIAMRLADRLNKGLVAEVEGLLAMGIGHERLQRLGLEYKYLSLYLKQKIDYASMVKALETAIVQFAKRQSTWFRKMEKEGINIHWLPANGNLVGHLEAIRRYLLFGE